MTAPEPRPSITQEPLRIAIAGAGAIGCLLAARLATAGHRVSLLARGETLARVQAGGVRLDDIFGSTQVRVQASDRPDFGPQDVLFLCSKSHDLPALAAGCKPLIAPETLIVPTPNGVPFWYFHGEGRRFDGQGVESVDPGGSLRAMLPLQQVIGASLYITAEAKAPGHIVSSNPYLMVLGELPGGISERLKRLCAVVSGIGMEGRAVENIRDPLWTKIIANITSNLLSVVTGATLDQIFGREDLVNRSLSIMHETMLVAACYGARLSIDPIEFVKLGTAMGPVRTSMLQDFERGRPLEIAAIGDSVIELADKYALPMPATRQLLAEVRAADQRRHAAAAAHAAA